MRYQRTDLPMEGRTDGRTDGRMDGSASMKTYPGRSCNVSGGSRIHLVLCPLSSVLSAESCNQYYVSSLRIVTYTMYQVLILILTVIVTAVLDFHAVRHPT